MVDTLVLGTSVARREGSSPFIRTMKTDSFQRGLFSWTGVKRFEASRVEVRHASLHGAREYFSNETSFRLENSGVALA